MGRKLKAGFLGIAALAVVGGTLAYALTEPAVRSVQTRTLTQETLVRDLAEWNHAMTLARDPYYELVNQILNPPKTGNAAARAVLETRRDTRLDSLACLRPIRFHPPARTRKSRRRRTGRRDWWPPTSVSWTDATELRELQARCARIELAQREALAGFPSPSAPGEPPVWWSREEQAVVPRLSRFADALCAVQLTCEARILELQTAAQPGR